MHREFKANNTERMMTMPRFYTVTQKSAFLCLLQSEHLEKNITEINWWTIPVLITLPSPFAFPFVTFFCRASIGWPKKKICKVLSPKIRTSYVSLHYLGNSSVLKATIENKTTSVPTHFTRSESASSSSKADTLNIWCLKTAGCDIYFRQ